jgi:addiction module RelE/StbE family toxin
MRVTWTRPALGDLDAIGDYIAGENQAAAERTVSRVLELVDMLIAHPHMGRAGRVPGTRELVIADTPFVLPYRVRDQRIEILAVYHGARKWPESFPG